jgi:hypothetical protein
MIPQRCRHHSYRASCPGKPSAVVALELESRGSFAWLVTITKNLCKEENRGFLLTGRCRDVAEIRRRISSCQVGSTVILTDAIQTLTLPVIGSRERLADVEQCNAGQVGEGHEHRMTGLSCQRLMLAVSGW